MKELLQKANMTQAEFARRIGVHQSMISQYIREDKPKPMSLEKAAAGAFVLGCHAEDFYEWIPDKRL